MGIDLSLPAADLISQGLADLKEGLGTEAALIVSIGAPRLQHNGISVSKPIADAERKLYELLSADDPDSAHSRYNALIRSLVSFENAFECARR